MLYLLRSWKDSLSLFLPKNFKLFFLVTLKGIVQVYKNLFKYFWWLILATGVIDYVFARYGNALSNSMVIGAGLSILLLLWFTFYFVQYLTIRPSLKPKGYEYYFEYGIYFLYFILYSLIAYVIRYAYQALWYPFVVADLLIYLSPLLTFCILFLLDSDGTFVSALYSVVRGFKMFLYNLPFCIIFYSFFWIATYVLFITIFSVFGPQSFLLSAIVAALLTPIPLCFLNNFYIKRLHDQFGLYYPETIKE